MTSCSLTSRPHDPYFKAQLDFELCPRPVITSSHLCSNNRLTESSDIIQGPFCSAHHFVVQQFKFIDVKGNFVSRNDEGHGCEFTACCNTVFFLLTISYRIVGLASLRRLAAMEVTHAADRYPPHRYATKTHLVLRQVTHWIDNPTSDYPFLWLYGPAEAGKSAMAQTVAEGAEENGCLAASLFFSRTNQTMDTASYLFPDHCVQTCFASCRLIQSSSPIISFL